jgi:hypothetical protein
MEISRVVVMMAIFAIALVTIIAVVMHFLLRVVRVTRWAIVFPLSYLIFYCSFCLWFCGCIFSLQIEGHEFGILSFFSLPVSFALPLLYLLDWLPPIISLLLLSTLQYFLLGWLIDYIIKKRKIMGG